MSLRPLFPTQVYEASLAAAPGWAELHEEILDLCLVMAEEDEAGIEWCKTNHYPGYTSYGSINDLPHRFPEFAELKRLLDKHAAAYARALHFDLAKKPRLDNLWVNVLMPGGGHTGHIHPHAIISGTIYIHVPDGASSLKIEDPRLVMMMARPGLTAEATEAEKPFVYLKPASGTILMWESWLRHEVPANRAEEQRISISFNYA
ncbi:MAG TPA: TIGR02466 family protein [Brevundimonas sp.]|nr:TIGR02466 family protein [Brevundimonas sp.]